MSLSNLTFYSNSLQRNININVYLPIDDSDVVQPTVENPRPFRLLILLHGLFGCNSDWIQYTRLTSYLSGKNIVVIMPNGDNSFYLDNKPDGHYYETLVRSELVNLARSLYPVSDKYEDTYIAGLSMGGFGSLRAGLVGSNTFSVIGSFSAPILPKDKSSNDFPSEIGGVKYQELIKSNGQDLELYKLIDQTPKLPKFYITCGTQDSLYQDNVAMVDHLESINADVTHYYDDYDHDWEFWDISINKFLDLL